MLRSVYKNVANLSKMFRSNSSTSSSVEIKSVIASQAKMSFPILDEVSTLLTHVKPGVVVRELATDEKLMIMDLNSSETKPLEIAAKKDTKYTGLPGNRLAIISPENIQIIDIATGSSHQIDINLPKKADTRFVVVGTKVSINNRFLLVQINLYGALQGYVVVVNLAAGKSIAIPVDSVKDFALLRFNQLMVLESNSDLSGHHLSAIDFDMKTHIIKRSSISLPDDLSIPSGLCSNVFMFAGWDNAHVVFQIQDSEPKQPDNDLMKRPYMRGDDIINYYFCSLKGNILTLDNVYSSLYNYRDPFPMGVPLCTTFIFAHQSLSTSELKKYDFSAGKLQKLDLPAGTINHKEPLLLFADSLLGVPTLPKSTYYICNLTCVSMYPKTHYNKDEFVKILEAKAHTTGFSKEVDEIIAGYAAASESSISFFSPPKTAKIPGEKEELIATFSIT